MQEMGKSLGGLELAASLPPSRETFIIIRGTRISLARLSDAGGNIDLLDFCQSCAAAVVTHHAKDG